MREQRRALIIPVEEQSRELEAKLLLACAATERGFPVILGSRHEIHLQIARLPRGLYYAKSFRPISLRMFEILNGLGYEIIACDEEGLLPYPDNIYFERRVGPETLALISNLFAWGPENAALFQRYPHYDGTPIHITGNPRGDLLRPELRGCYAGDVERLRDRYGDFVLINTNFGAVNHRVPGLVLANQPGPRNPRTDDYVEAISDHKAALFASFITAVPELARAVPDASIVVRPHSIENHDPWKRAAAGLPNVHVVHEGNVVPWLIAARAIVQNNCTTSIEAYMLGRPVVNYRPIRSERFDETLCAALSHDSADVEQLCETVGDILAGRVGACDGRDQQKLIQSHVTALDGPLASDRIVDVVDRIEASNAHSKAGGGAYAVASCSARLRTLHKRILGMIPGNKNNPAYQEQRFPKLAVADIEARIGNLARELGRFENLRVERFTDHIFRISSSGS